MPFLLDRVAVIEQPPVLPGEIVHLVEREAFHDSSRPTVPGELLLLRRVRDPWTTDEATAGDETVADTTHRVASTVESPGASERRVPERRIGGGTRRSCVGATAGKLRLQAPDVGEHEA